MNRTPHLDDLRNLLAVLQREHVALLSGDADEIEHSTRDKQLALARFQNLAPADDSMNLHGSQDFLALAGECRRQNEINGGMLAAGLRHTTYVLALLRGQSLETHLYTPRGSNTASPSNGQPIASA